MWDGRVTAPTHWSMPPTCSMQGQREYKIRYGLEEDNTVEVKDFAKDRTELSILYASRSSFSLVSHILARYGDCNG